MTIFKRFKSTYQTLKSRREEIKDLLEKDKDYLHDLYVQHQRFTRRRKEFIKVYRMPPEYLDSLIRKAYQQLSTELQETNSRVIKIKDDYLFIKGPINPRLKSLIPIKHFDRIETKQKKTKIKTLELKM